MHAYIHEAVLWWLVAQAESEAEFDFDQALAQSRGTSLAL